MRQLSAIAALVSCVALAQSAVGVSIVDGSSEEDVSFSSADAGVDPPLFSFASPSPFRGGYSAYQGLPATDGCYPAASVAGTKGEALTFTRATTRFCPTSANEATGVMCASGEVCIASSGSVRGMKIWPAAGTNLLLRSEEIDNAAWTKEGGTPASVSANDAAGPDAASTAERTVFAATTGAELSDLYQAFTVASGASTTCSVWVKGRGGTSGTTDLCIYDGAAWTCTDVAFTAAWKRYSKSVSSGTGTTRYCKLGNNSNQNGGVARSANDVNVYGFQGEASPCATPYVATTSASATRNAESASFAVTGNETQGSASLTYVPDFTAASGLNGWLMGYRGNSRIMYFQGTSLLSYDGTANPSETLGFVSGTASHRYNAWTAGASASSLDGTAWTMSADGFDDMDTQALRLGEQSAIITGTAGGLVSNVCLDTDPARCR